MNALHADLRRPHRSYSIRQLCLEFKCTPRALRFYEDKGLLSPAREGLNRVYNYKDRARLVLILQGKRVGLSLAEIGEILDLYEVDDGGVQQAAKSLRKFQERIVALEHQKVDIDEQIDRLRRGCQDMERRLEATRPDLLPRAADYDHTMRRQLDGAEH
ncbi:MAG: transcriptional regulator, MerR family [Phenylobacterium sp.]|nr:transcriptional regulator, MerR family [Phenylobacterium sp.]MDB5442237.1 transcriptional regulator, MerR family [Phenylobacterium sp.]MDB5493413.1 transcriptional regulator, MerR family [Phenylobacterium sp.]